MRCAKWTIAALPAISHLDHIKDWSFVTECCQQNAIFSVASHQNRSYVDKYGLTSNILSVFSTGTAATKWRMRLGTQDNFANKEGTNSKFSELAFFYSMRSLRMTSMYHFRDVQHHLCQICHCILPEQGLPVFLGYFSPPPPPVRPNITSSNFETWISSPSLPVGAEENLLIPLWLLGYQRRKSFDLASKLHYRLFETDSETNICNFHEKIWNISWIRCLFGTF